ncbi:TrmH family RNA methyltransferase [Lacicoccus alkaliphilus]|uniref:RNA methyltransferase, TrmH family n=1 Tax=Lacicoccus alkaliphilus DSM 16010 TaxID=1123231 RepID=A0A1M7ATK7_9BACL|nr:RNA methyltransferase [Salinicoccus alkaliphilus]SHL45997.1 RNA methyltransferase, TrmH family [Salinicoccus alkaliphilus DSM 16010]
MVREVITSKDNTRIKNLRKLHKRKERSRTGMFLIDGEHLVEEAVAAGQRIHYLIAEADYTFTFDASDFEVVYVSAPVLKSLSQLEAPQGVMAALTYVPPEVSGDKVLVLDDVQDPGNLGSLIRTADAFGFDRVVVSRGTVDPFSDKVLRSAQGSTFHISIEVADAGGAIREFDGMTIGTSLRDAEFLDEVPQPDRLLVVLGNEGRGVSGELLGFVDRTVKIHMPGRSESLNVAIAGGILMHHFKS